MYVSCGFRDVKWTAQAPQPTQAPSGIPVRKYFQTLLDWEPVSHEPEADDRLVVPIESLAPTVVPVASLAPEAAPGVVPIGALAPDVVDIATLAPDPTGSGLDPSDGQIDHTS